MPFMCSLFSTSGSIRARAPRLGLAILAAGLSAAGQSLPAPPSSQAQTGQSSASGASSFQGSVTEGEVSAQSIALSLDDAIQRGLRNNLGVILSGTEAQAARGQRLSQLQTLLPSVDFNAKEAVAQSDLRHKACAFRVFPP